MASPDRGSRNFKEVPRRVSLLGADVLINVRNSVRCHADDTKHDALSSTLKTQTAWYTELGGSIYLY